MSARIVGSDISRTWLAALSDMNGSSRGTATNVMVVVTAPQQPASAAVTQVVEEALQTRGRHGVITVANTLFPAKLYHAPGYEWTPTLSAAELKLLDGAAATLYENYLEVLPTLQKVAANKQGTYFSRMISWPGKSAHGVNQLAQRVEALRRENRQGRSTSNASDIAIAGEADGVGGSLEEYAASDKRVRAFPCLVHIDISVREGSLSLLAIYRHWHMITRGYGNLVGLAQLQQFLCQQTGYRPGEIAVVAGHANAEQADYGGVGGVERLIASARNALADQTREEGIV